MSKLRKRNLNYPEYNKCKISHNRDKKALPRNRSKDYPKWNPKILIKWRAVPNYKVKNQVLEIARMKIDVPTQEFQGRQRIIEAESL